MKKELKRAMTAVETIAVWFCIFVAGVMAGYAWAWHHFA
jgi:hypothetical protein